MTKSIDFTFWLPPVQNGVFPKIPDNANFEKNTYVCYDEDVSSPDIPCVRKWIPGKWSDPIVISSSFQSVQNVKPHKKKEVRVFIIRSIDFLLFQEQIREYLEKGYRMRGNMKISVVNSVTYYHQMMVKFHDESGS